MGVVRVCNYKRRFECLARLGVQESNVFVHRKRETPAAALSKNWKATEWGCSMLYPSLLLRVLKFSGRVLGVSLPGKADEAGG